jgi:AcrR family transcriptional regulator
MKTEHAEAKKRLFDAAVILFARKGYAAVGVREIATAAGANLSTVSYYYGGKAGLHRAIVNEANFRAAQMLAEAYHEMDYARALALLKQTAAWLVGINPDAAASLREGMEETLTVVRLGVHEKLRKTLASMLSRPYWSRCWRRYSRTCGSNMA